MAQKKEPERLNLNATQVAAGALASVTSAIVASRFGVGGTLVGAGLASVVTTTGSTLYSHVLRRTGSRARGVLDELPRHGHQGLHRAGAEHATYEPQARDDDAAPPPGTAVATPPPQDRDATPQPRDREATPPPRTAVATRPPRDPRTGASRTGRRSRRLPIWAVPIAASVLVFVVALGAITGVEAMTGRPAASWVGGSSPPSGTTVGSLVGGDAAPTPGPTHTATPAPSPINTPRSSVPAAPTQEPGSPSVTQPSAPAAGPSPAASPAASSPPQVTPPPIPNSAGAGTASGGAASGG